MIREKKNDVLLPLVLVCSREFKVQHLHKCGYWLDMELVMPRMLGYNLNWAQVRID